MAKTEDPADANQAQPSAGTVISPGSAEGQAVTPQPAAALPPEPTALPEPAPPPAAVPEASTEPPANETGIPQATDPADEPEDSQLDDGQAGQSVTWTASEFVAHDKSAGWYALLAAGTAVLAAAVFLMTKDLVSVAVIVVAGVLLSVYAGHQPRQQEYTLNEQGLGIGGKYYGYGEFKWFAIVPEGAFSSIVLMPHRRFAPLTTVYYAPEDEDRVLSILSQHLPMEEHTPDAVDSLVRRIRF